MNKITIKNCTLYHGDCFEIMPEISEADCMITDPPYGCTRNDWDYDIDLDSFWALGKAACKPNANFLIFCQMPFAAMLYMSNSEDFKYELIYVKPRPSDFLHVKLRPMRGHELIYIFNTGRPVYNPQMRSGKPYTRHIKVTSTNYGNNELHITNTTGEIYPNTILDVKHDPCFYTTKPVYLRHPTQKSVTALSYLVKTYTDAGDTILDPFMGSGSTGVAAVKHGRKFIGIEQDQKWFDVACKRIEAEYQRRGLLDIE